MKNINFSANWNNKLDCICFTSIRLEDSKKYIVGEYYNVCINQKSNSIAQLVDRRKIKLSQLTEGMARLDTGYGLKDTQRLFYRMYSKRSIDWNDQHLYWLLFVSNNTIKNG